MPLGCILSLKKIQGSFQLIIYTFHLMTWRFHKIHKTQIILQPLIPHPSSHHPFVASFDNGSQPTTPRPRLPKWQFHCETLRSGPGILLTSQLLTNINGMSPVVNNFERSRCWWLRNRGLFWWAQERLVHEKGTRKISRFLVWKSTPDNLG